MKIKSILVSIAIIAFLSSLCSCEETEVDISAGIERDIVISDEISKASPFVGIGTQWGGYDNVQKWTGSQSLSNADWDKLLKRVDYMSPGLIRLMGSPGWNYMVDGNYNTEKSAGVLYKILDYCQSRNINVMWGEWGNPPVNGNEVDKEWLNHSTNFLKHLINSKGYTCIKYYNMCNEPAGSWSSIAGNYDLWQRTYDEIYSQLESKGLGSKVKVIAPDIAVWNDLSLIDWITRPIEHFGSKIGAFDIHTYPSDDQLKGGNYKKVITDYRNAIPEGKEMIMAELGMKYDANSELGKKNQTRINNDPFTADDSNMMIYDAFYAVDIADAVLQNISAGYNGVVLWNMDDAMYDDGNGLLKRWGLWNILGEEKFGGAWDEEIRPWFYTLSLLCRYIPQGATIYKVELPNKKGVQAIAAEKDGKYTFVITNSHAASYSLNLKMTSGTRLGNADIYTYLSGEGAKFEGAVDENGFAIPASTTTVDLSNGNSYPITVSGRSFTLITNMK